MSNQITLIAYVPAEMHHSVVAGIVMVARDYELAGPSRVAFTWSLSDNGSDSQIYVWSRDSVARTSAVAQLVYSLPVQFASRVR